MSTYYRIQEAVRDAADLLTPEGQTSTKWYAAEDSTITGVSACESVEELTTYLVTDGAGIPWGAGEWVLVEMDADYHGRGHDGEDLVIPTAILSVTPLDDDFYAAIDTAYETAYAA